MNITSTYFLKKNPLCSQFTEESCFYPLIGVYLLLWCILCEVWSIWKSTLQFDNMYENHFCNVHFLHAQSVMLVFISAFNLAIWALRLYQCVVLYMRTYKYVLVIYVAYLFLLSVIAAYRLRWSLVVCIA